MGLSEINARLPKSSYYDKHFRQSQSLIRARQPFLVKNILTGIGLCGFVAGVYSYTIWAIGQDDFSDVQIPDAPAQPPQTPNTGVQRGASAEGLKERQEATMERAKAAKPESEGASAPWWKFKIF